MTCTTPGMLHVTSEPRAVALKYYNLEFTTFLKGKPIYFGFNRDMIFVVTCHFIDSFGGVFMALSVLVHRPHVVTGTYIQASLENRRTLWEIY
jgi:hypothetical protein